MVFHLLSSWLTKWKLSGVLEKLTDKEKPRSFARLFLVCNPPLFFVSIPGRLRTKRVRITPLYFYEQLKRPPERLTLERISLANLFGGTWPSSSEER